jgi:hypothetical protein
VGGSKVKVFKPPLTVIPGLTRNPENILKNLISVIYKKEKVGKHSKKWSKIFS